MPLPTTFPRLMLVCALLCLTALPAVSQASTSQSCLERCIPACRNASGGETGRAVCLGSCLGECPVYCGTVDTGCAQDCVNTSILDTTRDDKSLAAACARACTIKPNCPPPPEVKVLRAPPAASGKAPARAKVTLRIKKKDMDETFVARDRSFSVVVPWDWDLAEDSGLGPDGDYELKATAPGAEFLNYVQFSVRHVTDPGRTAEGFVNGLKDPRHPFPVRQQTVFSKGQLDGREATVIESRSVRTLIGFPDQVPSQERMMVLPLPVGFMVLTSDMPQAAQDKYGPALERMFQSFRLLAAPQAAAQEVSAEEYAVYGAFLTSGGVTEKGQGARPNINDAQPPHLIEAARARVVTAQTRTGAELTPKTLETFAEVCGGLDPALARDYGQKRAQNVLVADRIPAPGVRMRGEKKQGGMGTMERMRPPSGEDMLFGTPISFSRVGFDAGGSTALFYVANLGTSPGTSFLVLMVKRDGVWKLSCALMDNYIIY